MTELRYREHNDVVTVSLMGHAGFSAGNDIVCASISTVSYQLLNMLDELQDDRAIKDLSLEMGDGWIKAGFKVVKKTIWKTVWKVILTGYEQISEEYPNNLFIDI